MQRTSFHIADLCCADEERLIRTSLGRIEGVGEMSFNLLARTIEVVHTCPAEEITRALQATGFRSRRVGQTLREPETFFERHGQLFFTFISGVLLLAGVLTGTMEGEGTPLQIALLSLSILAGGWRIAVRAYHAVRTFAVEMNTLMTVAVIGAAIIGRWTEGASVIFLFALSQLLESYSMERTRRAIRSLMHVAPRMASVQRGGAEVLARVEEIHIGEQVIIRPGERIPLDGRILSGATSVDQAPITGESMPVAKSAGDEVFAGSLNRHGSIEIAVTHEYNDTMLARIVESVERAQAQRAPIQQFVDRFARIYTPVVLAGAVLVAVVPPLLLGAPFGEWFYRSLVLLVIACPCALVISTPVTIVSGLTAAARSGILIKGGRHLETIGRTRAIAFDKTGTLTRGLPRVTDVIALDSLPANALLALAAAIEELSEHPLASAIVESARLVPRGGAGCDPACRASNEPLPDRRFEALAGRGVTATIDGTSYVIGSRNFMQEQGLLTPAMEEHLVRLEKEGKTAMVLGTGRTPLGVIAVADTLRATAPEIIKRLHTLGIEKTIMLTGDAERTARVIAAAAGIDEVSAGVLPEDKVRRVEELKKRYGAVAMVGDGINDAPALAASSVGIAMGATGTDIALESADIVLMTDDLARLPALIMLGRRTLRIIRQNIAIALVTKIVFLALAVSGSATLWMAVLADDGATLVVILNGLRMLVGKSEEEEASR